MTRRARTVRPSASTVTPSASWVICRTGRDRCSSSPSSACDSAIDGAHPAYRAGILSAVLAGYDEGRDPPPDPICISTHSSDISDAAEV